MINLLGSIFVRNAIQFDYHIIESIESLLEFCDHVSVLDCSSKDGTIEVIRDIFGANSKVTISSDAFWDCASDNKRLSILANIAKDAVQAKWHFMLQADEVVHEDSYPAIRRAMSHGSATFQCKRINFYGDCNHHVRFDIPTHEKPCDDYPTRLGLHEIRATGDGESLDPVGVTKDFAEDIVIHHYGFVRDGLKLVDKTMSSLRWFFGNPVVDDRFVRMQADRIYRYNEIMRDDQLCQFSGTHPRVILPWIKGVRRW